MHMVCHDGVDFVHLVCANLPKHVISYDDGLGLLRFKILFYLSLSLSLCHDNHRNSSKASWSPTRGDWSSDCLCMHACFICMYMYGDWSSDFCVCPYVFICMYMYTCMELCIHMCVIVCT
jgi:hypothetical protein